MNEDSSGIGPKSALTEQFGCFLDDSLHSRYENFLGQDRGYRVRSSPDKGTSLCALSYTVLVKSANSDSSIPLPDRMDSMISRALENQLLSLFRL